MKGTGPTLFHDLDHLLAAAPLELGSTGWVEVEPDALSGFHRATWSQAGPGGEVPPMMLLSLTNRFLPDLLQVPAASSGVNYGADSVRFGPPAHQGDRVRAAATLLSAVAVGDAVQTTVEIRIEVDGATGAACTVHSLSRWMR